MLGSSEVKLAGRLLVFGGTAVTATACALAFSPPPTQLDPGTAETGASSKDAARDGTQTDHAVPGDAGSDSRADATVGDGTTRDAGHRDAVVAEHDVGAHDTGAHVDAGLEPYWSMSDTFDTQLGLNLWDGTPAVDQGVATLGIVDAGVTPHSGCCSLQATAAMGSPSYATISRVWVTPNRVMAPPVTSGTIAIRAYIQALTLANDTREMAVAAPQGPTLWYLTAGIGGSPPAWSSFLVNPANPDGGAGASGTLPAAVADGKWHCVEVQMAVSTDAGALAIFVDGASQDRAFTGNTSPPDGGWVSGTVGLGHSSGESPVNVFFDDVVIALYAETSTPPRPYIGCGAWAASTQ